MASPTRRRIRRFGYHLLVILARLCQPWGYPTLRRVGNLIGELRYRTSFRERRRLIEHIEHVLANDLLPEQVRPVLRHAYRVSDRSAFEIVAMGAYGLSPEMVRGACDVAHLERLETARAGGGAILLGMHMGNGILMAARLAVAGVPVSVVYRESRKMAPGFFERLLAAHGLAGIDARNRSGAYRRMARALREDRVVFVLMDQGTKHGGVTVNFLGKTLDMPAGPAELARRTGVPVLPAELQDAGAVWQFSIGEPLVLDPDSTEASAAALAESMERHIRAHPDLWSWHHRKWRRYPVNPEDASEEDVIVNSTESIR